MKVESIHNMNSCIDYNIIGCGVNGLTTGICLNMNGYNTRIITKEIPNFRDYLNKSETPVATEYAPASVKPSSIAYNSEKRINEMLSESVDIYNILSDSKYVTKMKHYLGGNNYEKPFYANFVDNYKDDPCNPPGDIDRSAVFDCLFVNMPQYIKFLLDIYRYTGGKIIENEVESMDNIKNPINCSGLGSECLTEDKNMKALKGYLAYVETGFRVKRNNNIESYAYNINNKPVYAYMQRNRIILGGSVLEEDEENKNIVTKYTEPYKMPKYIIEHNKKILKDSYNIDISKYPIYGFSGYRPYRSNKIRVTIDKNGDIHNYGHGGCGVTLSWGSALEVCRRLDIDNPKHTIKKEFKDIIN